jgi:hypothetical protein
MQNTNERKDLKLIRLDDKTEVWVLPHVTEEQVRERFANRKLPPDFETAYKMHSNGTGSLGSGNGTDY